MSWLWSAHTLGEWLLSVVAQTTLGFGIIVVCLTPLAGWLKRLYAKQTNPYTPGGAGDAPAPNGEPMHEYLASKTKPKRSDP